jgi:preprotein translocase subunit SecG
LGTYISFAVIIVVALLVASILMQVRGAGGGLFGAGSIQSYRTRRGVERTLFQFTIGLGVVFVILAVLNLTIT